MAITGSFINWRVINGAINLFATASLLMLATNINKVNAGMINCEGRVYSVEDGMISYIMCCGKQLFDARISRCKKTQSSSNSHRHYHEPDSLPLLTDLENEVEGNEVSDSDNNEDTHSIINKNNIIYDEISQSRGSKERTTPDPFKETTPYKKGSPKKPHCTEEDTLIWTSVDPKEETSDPLSYFPIGSLGCCGRRLYRKSAFFCCGSMLYPRTGRGQLCCGGIYYPTSMAPQFLACCNDTLVDVRARPNCASELQKADDHNIYYSLDNRPPPSRTLQVTPETTTTTSTTTTTTSTILWHLLSTTTKEKELMWYQIGHDYR